MTAANLWAWLLAAKSLAASCVYFAYIYFGKQ